MVVAITMPAMTEHAAIAVRFASPVSAAPNHKNALMVGSGPVARTSAAMDHAAIPVRFASAVYAAIRTIIAMAFIANQKIALMVSVAHKTKNAEINVALQLRYVLPRMAAAAILLRYAIVEKDVAIL